MPYSNEYYKVSNLIAQNKIKRQQKQTQKEDKPWWVDTLDFLGGAVDQVSRPYYAITGAIENATDNKGNPFAGLFEGAYKGFTLKEKKTADDIFNNLGWKDEYGKLGLRDIAEVGFDIFADPLTYLTFGGASALKAGAKEGYKALKASKYGKELGENVTARGQRKAIERVAQNQYDETMSKLADVAGDNRAYTTTGVIGSEGDARRIVDEGLQMVDGVKQEAKINPRLVEKLAEKKKQDVYKIAEEAAKKTRVEAQNALVNVDIPFFNIVYSFGKKGKWTSISDPLIKANQVAALERIMNEAGATPQQIELLKSGEATEKQITDIMSKIGFTDKQKQYLIQAVTQGRTTDISQLTRQEFEEAVRRAEQVKLRQLDNVGQQQTVKQITVDRSAEYLDNIANQMKSLMSTKYAKEMEGLRAMNPNKTDDDIIRGIIESENLPVKTGNITYLDLPTEIRKLSRKTGTAFSKNKSIPTDVRSLMEQISYKLSLMGKSIDDVFTNQFADILKSNKVTKPEKNEMSFKATVKDKSTGKYITVEKKAINKENFIRDLRRNGYSVNPTYVKESELHDFITGNTNAQKWDWNETSDVVIDFKKQMKEKKKLAEKTLQNKKTKQLTSEKIKQLLRINEIIDGELAQFVKQKPAYKNIIDDLEQNLRDPSRRTDFNRDFLNFLQNKGNVNLPIGKEIDDIMFVNPKGAKISELKNKKDIVDIVESTATQLPRNKNFTGLDLNPFQIDMGGASQLGSYVRRTNPFNARTFGSVDENVNAMGEVTRETENARLAQKRAMEKMALDIQKSAEGLTDEQKRMIPYLLERKFPDAFADGEVAKTLLENQTKLQELQSFLKELKKNTSQAKAHLQNIERVKMQIAKVSKELKDIRINNKTSYEDMLLKVANGDTQVADQLRAVVSKMETAYKKAADTELAAGTLKNTRNNYFPHIRDYSSEEINQLAEKFKNDPEIGQLIQKSAGNRFAKERKSFQTMADLDNTLAGLQERLSKVAADSPEFTQIQEKINVLQNLFERDPFEALMKRYTKSIKSVSMKKLQDTFRQNGFIHLPHEKPANASDFKKLNIDEARALSLPEGTYVHQEVLNGIKKVQDVFTDQGMNKVMKVLESVTNVFKTLTTTVIPSHYWYNIVGSVTNNAMAGVGLDAYNDAFKIMTAMKNGTLTPSQQKLIQQMEESGVLHQTSYSDMLPSSSLQIEQGTLGKVQKVEKAVVDNKATKAIRRYVSDPIDNYFRMANYLDALSKTRSHKMAAESVRKYLFNYAELTTADRAMKAFVPFWNWTKNNLPLQVHKALTTPRFGLSYAKIKDQTMGDLQEDTNIPDWIKSDYMKIGGDFYNPRLPLQDLGMLTSPNRFFSSLSPVFRSPIELTLNKQFYSGRPIDYDMHYGKRSTPDAAKVYDYLAKQVGLTGRAINTYEDLTNAQDSKAWYDILRDTLIGKSQNVEDVRRKSRGIKGEPINPFKYVK